MKRTIIRLGRGFIYLLPVVCALLLLCNLLPGILAAQEHDTYTAAGKSAEIKAIEFPDAPGLLNINTADLEELDGLPGIGPAIAQAIMNERESNGPYFYPEDLMDAKGIGESKFYAVRDMITTGE